MIDLREQRICVTGGAGFLGRHVVDALLQRGVPQEQLFVPRSADYDLTCEADVDRLYRHARPDIVIHLAAVVGGIGANRLHPGKFFYDNLAMGMHLIEHARRREIRKFVHTGTVCAYPKHCPAPFREEDLWSGFPEETNAPYGIAKKALFTMLEGYHQEYGLRSAVVVPVNLYGPHDNFDPETSHVIPALIRKFDDACRLRQSTVTCWGTGQASREFLHVTDAAEGIVRAAERVETPEPINLGTGEEITINRLAELIAQECGFSGETVWDESFPDGQPRRQLCVQRAARLLDWRAEVRLPTGIAQVIQWYRHGVSNLVA